MSNTLKTVGLIALTIGATILAGPAGTALAGVLGTSLAIGSAIATVGLTLGVGLLGKALGLTPSPKVSQATLSRLSASFDTNTPRKIVFGHTAMETDLRYQGYTGTDQEYVHWIVCVAAHEVEAIEELWFDTELAWSLAGGVTSKYSGYLTVTPRTAGTSSNGIAIDSVWTAACTLTGCAYFYAKFKRTGNSKKAESPFAQSLPSRLTVRGKGAKVPDLRYGGQSLSDQATWAYATSADSGRNQACQLLFYLLGWRINGKLSVGKGFPPERLDADSFITAANMNDEDIALAAGGTEPRYRSDGVFSEADQPEQVIATLLQSMNADLRDDGGRISLHVRHNDLADPDIIELTADDILGNESWRPVPSLEQMFNIVRGEFVDASDEALYQLVDVPEEVVLDSLDGIDRIDSFTLGNVQAVSQWQRLAKQRLQRGQYQGIYSADFGVRAWRARLGKPVKLSHPGLGWDKKLFRCVGQAIRRGDGSVPLVLQEEKADIYAWDAEDTAPVQAAVPTVYDPTVSPLVSAIGDAALTADLGDLALEDEVYFDGGYIKEAAGGSSATLTNFKTGLGTAAAITGQGSGATANNLAQLNAGEGGKLTGIEAGATFDGVPDIRPTVYQPLHYRSNYPGKVRREFHDAFHLAVPGLDDVLGHYGFLETIVDYSHSSGGPLRQRFTHRAGRIWERVGAADDLSWGPWGKNYNAVQKPAFGGDVLRETGALVTDATAVTSLGTAAAIAGQGSGATANNLSQLNTGEGNKLAGVETGATVGGRLGTNLYRELSGGGALLTDALAITSLGTAAAIANQGTGATANNVAQMNAAEGAKLGSIAAGAGPAGALTNIGSSPVTITNNTILSPTGDFTSAVRGDRLRGPQVVAMDIAPGATFTIISFDDGAGGAGYETQRLIAMYQPSSGNLQVYANGVPAPGHGLIASGLTGQLAIVYDDQRFHILVGGVVRGSPSASPDLELWPKWWAYSVGTTYSGLRHAPAPRVADIATNLIDSDASYAVVPRSELRTPLGTAAAIAGQGSGATANNLTALNATEGTKLGAIEAQADVTKKIVGPPTSAVQAKSGGTFETGVLPKMIALNLRNSLGTNLTATATWGVTVAGGSATATIPVDAGNAVLTVSALGAKTTFVVTASIGGVVVDTFTHVMDRIVATGAAGGTGTTGGTSNNASIGGSEDSSSYDGSVIAGPMRVKAGSGGQIACTAAYAFDCTNDLIDLSVHAFAKWQWSTVGGVMADIDAEAQSTTPASVEKDGNTYYRSPGEGSSAATKTGLTNGVEYDVRLVARVAEASRTLIFSNGGGNAQAVGS